MEINSGFYKCLSVLLIVAGEALSILAEMRAATPNSVSPSRVYASSVGLFALSGLALVAGYMLGYRAFASIWVITVISVSSLLIIEVALCCLMFNESPSLGSKLGLACGALGFLLSLTIK